MSLKKERAVSFVSYFQRKILDSRFCQWLFPVAGVSVAAGLRYVFFPVMGEVPYVVFWPVVITAAFYGGWGPGMLAMVLSVISATVVAPEILVSGGIAGTAVFVAGNIASIAIAARLRNAQRKMRNSQQRLRATFDNAGVGIVEVDQQDRVVAANNRLQEMLGYTARELEGMSIHDLTVPEDRTKSYEMNERLHSGQLDLFSYEKRYLRRDGRPLWVYVNVSAIRDEEGRHVRSIATVTDISERKQAEEALKESERSLKQNQEYLIRLTNDLKSKNEELESLVSIATHDLRSPVVNLMGFSGELARSTTVLKQAIAEAKLEQSQSDTITSVIETEIPEEISFIQDSTRAIDRMLRSVLKVIHFVLADLKTTQINTSELVRKVVESYEQTISSRKIDIIVEDLPDCRADQGLMREVFTNLIDNAIKYLDMSRPGRINIRGFIKNQYAIFCVEDNGRGIAPEHQHNVFKLFHRLELTGEGEGVGLTIVRRLVNRQDGNIWLESQPGKGSKFFVALPAAVEAA